MIKIQIKLLLRRPTCPFPASLKTTPVLDFICSTNLSSPYLAECNFLCFQQNPRRQIAVSTFHEPPQWKIYCKHLTRSLLSRRLRSPGCNNGWRIFSTLFSFKADPTSNYTRCNIFAARHSTGCLLESENSGEKS